MQATNWPQTVSTLDIASRSARRIAPKTAFRAQIKTRAAEAFPRRFKGNRLDKESIQSCPNKRN